MMTLRDIACLYSVHYILYILAGTINSSELVGRSPINEFRGQICPVSFLLNSLLVVLLFLCPMCYCWVFDLASGTYKKHLHYFQTFDRPNDLQSY